jgi:hypothetical protein
MNLTQRQIENFWKKVDKRGPDECWLWTGGTDRRGYGLITFNNKSYRAPRISLMLRDGALPPPELDACHCCDNPRCVNPNHLSGCTRSQNMRDASKRGRLHIWSQKLTRDQVVMIRAAHGKLKDIAAVFGLDPSTVSKIRSCKIWRNLPC